MLKKILLNCFINTSLLISTCSAMDFKDTPSLTLSVKKLERGCKAGRLELKDGTTWEVKNLGYLTNFCYLSDKKQRFNGVYDQDEKSFHFEHSVPGGFVPKWNEEKKEWEEEHFPGTDFFNLSIKQIIEEKSIILKNEKNSAEDFIEFGGLRIPRAMCQWDPHTQKFTLDFSNLPHITDFLNSQFNLSSKNQTSIDEKSTTLAIEDKSSNLIIEENDKKDLIESNKNYSSQSIDDSHPKEQEIITSLSLTIAQLNDGFTTGSIILDNGTKWTVTNGSPWNFPDFCMSNMTPFIGNYSSSEDVFYFTEWEMAGYNMKWNEEKKEWEIDYSNPMGGRELFNLIIKRSY